MPFNKDASLVINFICAQAKLLAGDGAVRANFRTTGHVESNNRRAVCRRRPTICHVKYTAEELRLPDDPEIHCLAPFLKRVGLPIAMTHSACRLIGADDDRRIAVHATPVLSVK